MNKAIIILLKDVKLCVMLWIHLLKEGMKQYLGNLGRFYENLSLDIMREYNTLMISSEQSDFYNIKRRKIMSDAGNSSSECRIETIFRLLRSKLWIALTRYHEERQLSNDYKLTKRFFFDYYTLTHVWCFWSI